MQDPNLLVGIDTGDDAAVYRLADDLCIIQTVDFFPPIVDDPYTFGAIAAANALSDVYAMGGKPLMALNIACFPDDLDIAVLRAILQGGHDKVAEAGAITVGGHTIKDSEPKYGLSVTGVIRESKVRTNANSKPGDALILTKPLGTGIVSTAAKQEACSADVLAEAVGWMLRLNAGACTSMQQLDTSAATDITGFGLIGHLIGMMKASGTTAELSLSGVPLINGTRQLAQEGHVPTGTRVNLNSYRQQVKWLNDMAEVDQLLLCDSQTSGGLLLSVPQSQVVPFLEALELNAARGWIIGSVSDKKHVPVSMTK